MSVVLDASALLAYVRDEPGAEVVDQALEQGAYVSAVNWAEALSKLAVIWVPSFEQVTPGLSIAVLREAIRVAGWVRSDWREIHELLNS